MTAFKFNPDALRRIRRESGIAQRLLAEEIGVAHTTISHWESGHFKPSVDHLFCIAAVLSVEPGDLMTRAEVAA
ncbi:helix-turn-helix transcriptional regulator [Streptomyces lavendulae]|uniref:helix-turn-helix domain-containing protein n=1 Tax=Streptomyces lavendulae TaxID=1914 RepID=UPI003320BF66